MTTKIKLFGEWMLVPEETREARNLAIALRRWKGATLKEAGGLHGLSVETTRWIVWSQEVQIEWGEGRLLRGARKA